MLWAHAPPAHQPQAIDGRPRRPIVAPGHPPPVMWCPAPGPPIPCSPPCLYKRDAALSPADFSPLLLERPWAPPLFPLCLMSASSDRRATSATGFQATTAVSTPTRWALPLKPPPPPTDWAHPSLSPWPLLAAVHHRSHYRSPERCRCRRMPPPTPILRPHRCHVASIRARPPHLARPSPGCVPVVVGKTLLPGTPPVSRATASAPCAVTAVRAHFAPSARPAMLKWLWARPAVSGPWAESGPALCCGVSDFLFSFIIPENHVKFQNT
jgi:hypothetical protein